MKVKRIKKGKHSVLRYKSLPPHTNEAVPVTHLGEVSKPFIIVAITIAAIVLLAVFLMFKDQIVGKAFFVAGVVDTAGIANPGSVLENTPFSLLVRANIGTKETTGIEFEFPLPTGLRCRVANPIENLLGWNAQNGALLEEATCVNNVVHFRYLTVNGQEAKRGEFDIARIHVEGAAAGTYTSTFRLFNIINLATPQGDIITNGLVDPLVVRQVGFCQDNSRCQQGVCNTQTNRCAQCVADAQCSGTTPICNTQTNLCEARAPACGNQQIDVTEQCDDGNTANGDGCSS